MELQIKYLQRFKTTLNMRRIFVFLILNIMSIGITFSHVNTSNTHVQSLKRSYKSVCDSGSIEAKKQYFEIFPSTFSEFKDVFGYEETKTDAIFGELYEESLEYVTAFFRLNEVIDPYSFSKKVIGLCINGKWQADGVNYLKANVVNIVTSDNNHDCYYNYSDFFTCYNDTIRETLLACLAQCSEEEILSFWQFYLDEVATISVDKELFLRTKCIVPPKTVLAEKLEKAYFLSQGKPENN